MFVYCKLFLVLTLGLTASNLVVQLRKVSISH